MKRFRRILCAVMTIVMTIGAMTGAAPVQAYNMMGNYMVEEHDASIGEGIFWNLLHYAGLSGGYFSGEDDLYPFIELLIMSTSGEMSGEEFLKFMAEEGVGDAIGFFAGSSPTLFVAGFAWESMGVFWDFGETLALAYEERDNLYKYGKEKLGDAKNAAIAGCEKVYGYWKSGMEIMREGFLDAFGSGVQSRGGASSGIRKLTRAAELTMLRAKMVTAAKEIRSDPDLLEMTERMLTSFDAFYQHAPEMVKSLYAMGREGMDFSVLNGMSAVRTSVPVTLTSVSNGKRLNVYTDLHAKKVKNGTTVNTYRKADDTTQEFRFIKKAGTDNVYYIRLNEGTKFVDVYNTSTKKLAKIGAKVQIWAKSPANFRDQTFMIEYIDGFRRIVLAENNDYCLAVNEKGAVVLAKCRDNAMNQLWHLEYLK